MQQFQRNMKSCNIKPMESRANRQPMDILLTSFTAADVYASPVSLKEGGGLACLIHSHMTSTD